MSLETTPATQERKLDADRVLQALLRPLMARRKLSRADLEGVLESAMQKALELARAESLAVCLVRPDGRIALQGVHHSRAMSAAGGRAAKEAGRPPLDFGNTSVAPGAGVAGKVVQSRQPYIAYSALAEPDLREDIAAKCGLPLRSMLAVPLLVDGHCKGVIEVINKLGDDLFTAPDFSVADLELLTEVARYGSKALVKALDAEVEFTEKEVAGYTARLARLDFFDIPEGWKPDPTLLGAAGEDVLRKYLVLPVERTSARGVKLAMANPFDIPARDSFYSKTSLEVETIVVAAESAILRVLSGAFAAAMEPISTEEGKKILAGSAPGLQLEKVEMAPSEDEQSAGILQLANRIIEDAYAQGSSDIHIEPFEKEVKVRFRVDGYLKEVMTLPVDVSRALVSRIKIMSRSMDITENRLPQDGRIKFKQFTKTGLDIDLRVSTAPLAFGQKVVMRILDKGNTTLGLDKMGFSERNLRLYREMIQKPYGMVLHVGPTGSGKTTTLYSALSELNKPDINIQTAEDPIEYMLPNVNQMQMQKEIGLTFAAALRCFLRQDPDIILVGEIRDVETAQIAVEAALTGHLIFSTLHTNDAPGTVTRLADMGVEPFLISSSVLIVCAQRLMRRLCPKCKVEHAATPYECMTLGIQAAQRVFKATPGGCAHCKEAGYKGRTGVHEVMTLSDEMKTLIGKGAPAEELREAAIANGMIPLYDDAMEKVLQGITSIEEALAVVRKE